MNLNKLIEGEYYLVKFTAEKPAHKFNAIVEVGLVDVEEGTVNYVIKHGFEIFRGEPVDLDDETFVGEGSNIEAFVEHAVLLDKKICKVLYGF